MEQWNSDMDEAPIDGSRFLAVWKRTGSIKIVWWLDYGSGSFTDGTSDSYGTPHQYGSSWFSHWMPLPAPPLSDV